MLTIAMTRLSLLRIGGFLFVATASWLGCVKDESQGQAAPICPSYCDALDTNCPGLEYKDRDQCLATCARMKPGNEGQIDDTAGCRLTQAKNAAKNDEAACKKGSAFGGEACGTPCTTFCNLVDELCIHGEGAPADHPYPTEETCIEECNTKLKYDKAGSEGQKFVGGDTLNCRMFHLLLALDDRVTHCPHTGVISAVCKDP
jgi:hypothetical protein